MLIPLFALANAARAQDTWAPWERTDIRREISPTPNNPRPTWMSVKIPFQWGISIYQKTVSRADGPTCNQFPTCSAYGALAIRKHGPALGFVMASERMMRSHKARPTDKRVTIGGVKRIYDPVEANDFWWVQRREKE